MNAVRRALVAVTMSSTAVAGVAVAGASAALATTHPAPTSLAISAPQQITYSKSGTVTGTLTTAGGKTPLAGQAVTLEERAPGKVKWTVVGTPQNTDAKGVVTFSVSPARTVQVELVHAATATTKASTSATAEIKVAYDVTAALSGDTVTATVAPIADRQKVLLQIQGKNQQWSTLQTKLLAGPSQATFTITPPKAKGTYSYRVVKLAAHGFLGGVSNTVQLTV